jgi:hypothetical protein
LTTDILTLVVFFLVPVLVIGLIVWGVVRLVGTRPLKVAFDAVLDVPPEQALPGLTERAIPVMQAGGYRLTDQGPVSIRFVHRYRPAWVILLAIFLFPIGLLFLLITQENDLMLTAGPFGRGGTRVAVSGRAGAETRRQLEEVISAPNATAGFGGTQLSPESGSLPPGLATHSHAVSGEEGDEQDP